jgi:uncharacterized protein
MASSFFSQPLRFQCQGSGNCCVSRGEYGYVYVTLEDRRRMARHFAMSTSAFTRKHCFRAHGIWALKGFDESCVFLKDKKCSVYEARPTQCRTWPFWPEHKGAKAWKKEVADFCPGVGKGKLWSVESMNRLAQEQVKSEEQYGD